MLMTAKEVAKRLSAGEDPLDLVEEKWKRLKAYVEEKGLESVVGDNLRANTCAFCSVFIHKGGTSMGYRRCWQCPYMIVRGISCDESHPGLTDCATFFDKSLPSLDEDIAISEPWHEIATAFGSWPYSLQRGEGARRSRFISACDRMLVIIDEIRNGVRKKEMI